MNLQETGRTFTLDLPFSSCILPRGVVEDGTTQSWSIPWSSVIPATFPSYATYRVTHSFREYDSISFFRDMENNIRRTRAVASNLVANSTMVVTASDNELVTTNGPATMNVMSEEPTGGITGAAYNPSTNNGLAGLTMAGLYVCKPRSFLCVSPESYPVITISYHELAEAPSYDDLTTAPLNALYYQATPVTLTPDPRVNYMPQFYVVRQTGANTNEIQGLKGPAGIHTLQFELLEKKENPNRMY